MFLLLFMYTFKKEVTLHFKNIRARFPMEANARALVKFGFDRRFVDFCFSYRY